MAFNAQSTVKVITGQLVKKDRERDGGILLWFQYVRHRRLIPAAVQNLLESTKPIFNSYEQVLWLDHISHHNILHTIHRAVIYLNIVPQHWTVVYSIQLETNSTLLVTQTKQTYFTHTKCYFVHIAMCTISFLLIFWMILDQ